MRLKIINSNSAGNCYILENDQEALIIECGVRFKRIKQAMGFSFTKVKGVLISHEHGDHSTAVRDVLGAGLNVYSSFGTIKALGIDRHHRAHAVDNQPFQVGGFTVMAFDVKHDCADPVGFLIDHDETGLVLFLTDTYFIPYTFPGLNNILVEANYSQEILDERVARGEAPTFLRNRVISSHMSLETCKQLLAANDLSQVNKIILIHLSDGNSNEKQFVNEVAALTGKTVMAARAGMEMEFNKTAY